MRPFNSLRLAVSVAIAMVTLAVALPAAARAQQERPGIGRSDADPLGTPFNWPAGLVVEEPITAYHEDYCRNEEERGPRLKLGLGVNVRLCLSFINTTPAPVRVTLPAGLIFISISDDSQNGLLVLVESFEVPPGDTPYFVELDLQCMNINRAPAGTRLDTFRPGPVTTDPELASFVNDTGGRSASELDMILVQEIVWKITDNVPMTPDAERLRESLRDR